MNSAKSVRTPFSQKTPGDCLCTFSNGFLVFLLGRFKDSFIDRAVAKSLVDGKWEPRDDLRSVVKYVHTIDCHLASCKDDMSYFSS